MAHRATLRAEASKAKGFDQHLSEWLGTKATSEPELVSLVEKGLPLGIVERLVEHGLTRQEVFHIINHERTRKHRRSRRQPLSREESDRALRTARLLARAETVMGAKEEALKWLRGPKRRFEGRSPLQMMATEAGGRMVEEMLIQVEEGMFA